MGVHFEKVKPIDMKRVPAKPKWYLRILIVILSFFYTLFYRIKIRKINCEKLKWPYIIIASHASFMDFAMCAKMTFPHHTNYICSIEEFVGREWLMRGAGCFPKRKYTKDSRNVKHILNTLKKKKNSVTIYAEARYSLIGKMKELIKVLVN